MQINSEEIRPGDNLIFKRGKGPGIALFLSMILKVFYPHWDMWGWHMAIIVRRDGEDWMVLEATWPQVRVSRLSALGEYRVYRWFEKESDPEKIQTFVKDHLGNRYDVWKYLWTTAYCLLSRFKINLGKWDNDAYYCWELVEEFAEYMGKSFTTGHKTLILPDYIKLLEKG